MMKKKILSVFLACIMCFSVVLSVSVNAEEENEYVATAASLSLGEMLGITIYTNIPYAYNVPGTFSLNGRAATVYAQNKEGYCAFAFKEIVPNEMNMPITFSAKNITRTVSYGEIIVMMLNQDGYDISLYKLLSNLYLYGAACEYYTEGSVSESAAENLENIPVHFNGDVYDPAQIPETDKAMEARANEVAYIMSINYFFSNYNKLCVVFYSEDVSQTTVTIGERTFVKDSFNLVEGESNVYCVYSDPIAAKDLDKTIDIYLKYRDDQQNAMYSTKAYANSILSSEAASESAKQLVYYLYRYGVFATGYVDLHGVASLENFTIRGEAEDFNNSETLKRRIVKVTNAQDGIFTINYDKACSVFVEYQDGAETKYKRMVATPVSENSYSFDLGDIGFDYDKDTMQIYITLRGDVNGDGIIDEEDADMSKAASISRITLDSLALQVCDTDYNGKINSIDATRIKSVSIGKYDLDWDFALLKFNQFVVMGEADDFNSSKNVKRQVLPIFDQFNTEFKVNYNKACCVVVDYIDNGIHKFEKLTAEPIEDNVYLFNTKEFSYDIATAVYYIIIKGDINMNGQIDDDDANKSKDASISKYNLNEMQFLVADENNDGKVNAIDATRLKSASIGKYEMSWDITQIPQSSISKVGAILGNKVVIKITHGYKGVFQITRTSNCYGAPAAVVYLNETYTTLAPNVLSDSVAEYDVRTAGVKTTTEGYTLYYLMKGDVTQNGDITDEDATYVKELSISNYTHCPNIESNYLQFCAADVDGNGVIDAIDATRVKSASISKYKIEW